MTEGRTGGIDSDVNESGEKEEPVSPHRPGGAGDGGGAEGGFLPRDVRRGILAAMPNGGAGSTSAQAKKEHSLLAGIGLSVLASPAKKEIFAKGKEHVVTLQGDRVWKYQDGPALMPIAKAGKLEVKSALPSEYLDRLDLQNELFGDDLRVEGFLKNGKLVTSQSALVGTEPTEKEIEGLLKKLGWQRVPANQQLLPDKLMATAWVHPGEGVVMVDARPPNFKKTENGDILAIDLMLVKAVGELQSFMEGLE